MSRIAVCDRCQETGLLTGGVLTTSLPDGWHELHWSSGLPVDLCSPCYKEFTTGFLGKL